VKLEVGRIARAHGLRGEVVIDPITDQPGRFDAGAAFDTAKGRLVILASRPFQHRFLVSFESCTTREQAEALRGVSLEAEPLEDSEELFVHQLVGCSVVDQDGVARGTVTSVEANPASDLLVLDSGSLVPLTFVTSVDGRRIEVDVPAGLFD